MALVAMLLGSCTAMMNSSTYGSNDLYRTDNRETVARELTAMAEAEKAQAEARKAKYEAMIAEAEYNAMMSEDPSFTSVLATDYESAYARRLYGFNSPTYRMPMTYYDLSMRDAMFYASAYDPAFYNVMVSGDQVWVEPKYITSMFGSWGATNVTFGIYASPWTYGWNMYVDPFYYSWWGYPRYSWYDWNWTICYNPYYYPGYYPYYPGYYPYYPGYYPYPPHPHHPPMPPQHRPGHGPGGGHDHNMNGDRHHTASRYTSPTSNRNFGTSGSRGGSGGGRGAVSTGYNDRRTYAPGNNSVAPTRPTGNRNNSSERVTRNDRTSSNAQHSNHFRTGTGLSNRSGSTNNNSNYNRSSSGRDGMVNSGSGYNRSSGSGSFSGGGTRGGGGSRSGGGSTSSRR